MLPYDSVGPNYRDASLGARRPSRLHSIEELPIALGMLLVAGGEFGTAVLGGVNYGRDSDSIATMAGAISGALHGVHAIPGSWASAVSDGSRIDLAAPGRTMAAVAREVFDKDQQRRQAQTRAFAQLRQAPSAGYAISTGTS